MGLWNYASKATVWLPMGHADHDPVNTRTLNRGRGGAALDAVFGAGAATPTKIADRHGYTFDGGDVARIAALPTIEPPWSIAIVYTSSDAAPASQYIVDVESGRLAVGFFAAPNVYLGFSAAGTAVHATAGTANKGDGRTHTAVLSHDGTSYYFHIDGRLDVTSAVPASVDLSGAIGIGAHYSVAGNYHIGGINHLSVHDGIALSPLQVMDWHIAASREWHRI